MEQLKILCMILSKPTKVYYMPTHESLIFLWILKLADQDRMEVEQREIGLSFHTNSLPFPASRFYAKKPFEQHFIVQALSSFVTYDKSAPNIYIIYSLTNVR